MVKEIIEIIQNDINNTSTHNNLVIFEHPMHINWDELNYNIFENKSKPYITFDSDKKLCPKSKV